MVSYSHSIVTMAIACIISEVKRNIGRKSRFLPLHWMPVTYITYIHIAYIKNIYIAPRINSH